MASQINIYQEEIFNFLRTVTIKFEPFAYIMGQEYMNEYGIDNPHGKWNPYYINLTGEYTENDTRMTVYSPEIETQVPFDKDLISHYPKTAALYRIPNQEYTTLEERYPENRGLIKSIAYPVEDIQAAIDAPNLSLLAYDASLLHENERESMLNCLRRFLEMVRIRWWIDEYVYEDMFAITFWAMLWQHLPNLLLTQRFLNIRTTNVHPFHIWEYLKSRGLGDYRDVLSNNQSLWLYRNIDYILKNKGKNSNLIILAENLLQEIFVSLLYKDMYQDAGTMLDEVRTTPQFRSFNVIDDKEVKLESFHVLNERLVETGIEYRNSADFVLKEEQLLGEHNFNILPTKLLELRRDPVNTSNESLMANFFLDTLMYRYSKNNLSFQCVVQDPNTQSRHKLFVGDVILLWYWALHRSIGETPTVIPTKYNCHIAYQLEQPQLKNLRQDIYYKTGTFRIKWLVAVEELIKLIAWHPRPFTKADEFGDSVVEQFVSVLNNKVELEQSNKLLYHRAMHSILEDITINQELTLNFGKFTTFDQWRASNEVIDTILTSYKVFEDNTLEYEKLAKKCFDALFPIDYDKWKNVVGVLRNIESIYTSIRDLFIQLGSYNITYLENDRETNDYITIPEHRTYLVSRFTDMWHFWNIIISGLYPNPKHVITLPFRVLELNTSVGLLDTVIEQHLGINIPFDFKIKYVMEGYNTSVRTNYQLQHISTKHEHRQQLNLAMPTVRMKEIPHAK